MDLKSNFRWFFMDSTSTGRMTTMGFFEGNIME